MQYSYKNKMDTKFMNFKNSKTSDSHILLLIFKDSKQV